MVTTRKKPAARATVGQSKLLNDPKARKPKSLFHLTQLTKRLTNALEELTHLDNASHVRFTSGTQSFTISAEARAAAMKIERDRLRSDLDDVLAELGESCYEPPEPSPLE